VLLKTAVAHGPYQHYHLISGVDLPIQTQEDTRADVGIAMGALGSDAAIEAADVVLMDDDPAKIALAMRIARRTLRIVYQNIVFALAIKFACLVLGAIGMASMWTAIFADVGVMVLAVLNATRALYTKDLAKKNEQ
jgi:Zn2+/Cd2+-exporting ATPase